MIVHSSVCCYISYLTFKLFSFYVLQSHSDRLNTQVALHQLYQYASKYYDGVRVPPLPYRTQRRLPLNALLPTVLLLFLFSCFTLDMPEV